MDKLYTLREMLLGSIVTEFEKGIHNVDVEEMGKAVDILKDVEEIIAWRNKDLTKTM